MARLTGRRIAWLVLLLVIVGVGFAIHYYSRPERISAVLVDQLQSRYGLSLALPQPARVEFLPVLHLELDRPVLTALGGTLPLIEAERIELRMPWSTLYGAQPVIERIDLVQPRIDIDAVQAWLATQGSSVGATVVPAFTLSASDATVMRGGQPLATALNLQLVHAGELGAWIDQWSTVAGPASPIPPMNGTLDAATIRIGDTQLDGIKLRIDERAAEPVLPSSSPPKP